MTKLEQLKKELESEESCAFVYSTAMAGHDGSPRSRKAHKRIAELKTEIAALERLTVGPTAEEMEIALKHLLNEVSPSNSSVGSFDSVSSFEEAGILTHEPGLVIQVGKAEFQLAIRRSR